MRAYSPDLRQRVLDSALGGDLTQTEVAHRFSVSLRFTREAPASLPHHLEPRPPTSRRRAGGRRRCIPTEHEPVLIALLEADNDATEAETAARFRATTGRRVSTRAINRTWQPLGLTRKKDASGERAEPARGGR